MKPRKNIKLAGIDKESVKKMRLGMETEPKEGVKDTYWTRVFAASGKRAGKIN